jgi:DNA-3-methyladenine glycosylase
MEPMAPRAFSFGPVLRRGFYERPTETVARELLGKVLARGATAGVIVETEAYLGVGDLAAHASRGLTDRTRVIFGPPGHAYVYFIYGMYDMLNIVTGKIHDPQAVLLRAAEPLDGWTADLSGPGKLTRALHITRAQDRLDLTGPTLHFLPAPPDRPPTIAVSARIGVDYAKQWKDAPLRFFDPQSPAVSGPRRTAAQALRGNARPNRSIAKTSRN